MLILLLHGRKLKWYLLALLTSQNVRHQECAKTMKKVFFRQPTVWIFHNTENGISTNPTKNISFAQFIIDRPNQVIKSSGGFKVKQVRQLPWPPSFSDMSDKLLWPNEIVVISKKTVSTVNLNS